MNYLMFQIRYMNFMKELFKKQMIPFLLPIDTQTHSSHFIKRSYCWILFVKMRQINSFMYSSNCYMWKEQNILSLSRENIKTIQITTSFYQNSRNRNLICYLICCHIWNATHSAILKNSKSNYEKLKTRK